MTEFLLFFRMDITNEDAQPTKEQMKIYMQQWSQWVGEIEKQGQLADGNHLSKKGRVLTSPDKAIDTPYVSDNNSVAGYLIILAEDLEGATKIAKKCPILGGPNTSVEIREVANPG